jgi:hypothetical protein
MQGKKLIKISQLPQPENFNIINIINLLTVQICMTFILNDNLLSSLEAEYMHMTKFNSRYHLRKKFISKYSEAYTTEFSNNKQKSFTKSIESQL